jgi:hypothetical protein
MRRKGLLGLENMHVEEKLTVLPRLSLQDKYLSSLPIISTMGSLGEAMTQLLPRSRCCHDPIVSTIQMPFLQKK